MTVDCLDLSLSSVRWKTHWEATGSKTIEQIRVEKAKDGPIVAPVPPPRGGQMMDPREGPGDSKPRAKSVGPSHTLKGAVVGGVRYKARAHRVVSPIASTVPRSGEAPVKRKAGTIN